jgi:hypothetical protein
VPVAEQPLVVACARTIEADLQRRGDEQAHDVGPRRGVHVQQRGEAPRLERAPHGGVAAKPKRLVEHDELDAFEPREQRVLGLADDPCEPRRRPRTLDRAHDGHRVARVADRREPDHAELGGRMVEGQAHGATVPP